MQVDQRLLLKIRVNRQEDVSETRIVGNCVMETKNADPGSRQKAEVDEVVWVTMWDD